MSGCPQALRAPASVHLHPAPAAPAGAELVEMLGEAPVAVEGKQVWQQEKGKNVIFQFASDIFQVGSSRVFLTAERKAELTGSNTPRSSVLVWVESVNFWLQK